MRPPSVTAILSVMLPALVAAGAMAAPVKGGGSGTWVKRFHPAYLDTAWSAAATRDGHLVVGIQSMDLKDKPNTMVFAKLDAAGKTLWLKRLPSAPAGTGHQSCEIPMALREAADGTLLVAGTRCNQTYTTYYQAWPYAWYARLSPGADPLWEAAPDRGVAPYPNGAMPQSYGWDVAEWPDGGVLGLGLHTGPSGYSLWLLDLAVDGRLRTSRADYNTLFDEYWWGVSGGYGDGGMRIAFTVGDNRGDARIGWLERDLRFRDEAPSRGPEEEEARGLRPSPEGGYCLLLKQGTDLWLERRAADGASRWRHNLDGGLGTRLLATRDGGCLVAGGAEAGTASLRLRKYDRDGRELWRQEIDGRWSPKSLLETAAGALVVTGLETPPDFRGSTAFVLHLAPADLGRVKVRPARR